MQFSLHYSIIFKQLSYLLLGAFAKLRKASIRSVVSVRPSVRMEQLGSHWTDFHEILYFSIFLNPVEKIKVSFKYNKNNGYFTWRPIYKVIHKSLRDFRPLRFSSRDGHAEGEHVSCFSVPHTLHVCGRSLIAGLTSAASPRVDVSSTCKLGQKFGVSLPLLTCSPSG